MAIFFIIVLTVYFLVNLYLYIKGQRALAGAGYHITTYTIIFVVLATAFIAGKILEYKFTSVFTDVLSVIGGFWMAFMLYGCLIWFLADILLLVQKPFHLVPDASMPKLRFWIFTGITVTTVILIVAGFITAVSPVKKRYDLTIDKSITGVDGTLRIVAVSDIHLGSVIRKRSMRHLSEMIRNEKPDLVLFLGDLIDGSIGPVLRGDLLSYLTLPYLPYGKYAITGNHEYIGDIKKTVPYIESKGIRVLKDEVVTLPDGVQIIGRLDRSANQGSAGGRAPLDSLLARTDPARPVILLDHQPYGLSDLAATTVDLQLSGHTHHGQIWPLTFVTSKMFELSYGYAMFGKTHAIVSSDSGYGARECG